MSENLMRVDMVGTARDVQWSADTFLGYGSTRLVAPAKVNLFLGIGERREDGYHDVLNIMHAVALHDTIYLNVEFLYGDEAKALAEAVESGRELPEYQAIGGPESNVLVTIDSTDKGGTGYEGVPAAKDLIFKAIDLLARETNQTAPQKVLVRVEKNIPAQGGLGGGSSDAAAALVGVAKYWGLAADGPEVVAAAQKLGADVAFFLYGGCVQLAGTGEIFVRNLPTMKDSLVLIKPEGGVSTGAAYAAFDEAPIVIDPALSERANEAATAADVPIFNNLAPASESVLPELVEVREWASAQEGVTDVLLCGSGATTFAVVESFSAACRIAAEAQKRGWWARATMFSSLRAAVRPK